MVDTIDDWTARLPKTGPIEGAIFNEGMGLALLLADPERMARHGAGQLDPEEPWVPEDPEQGAPEPEDIQPEEPQQLTLVDFDAEFGSLFETDMESEAADESPAALKGEHTRAPKEEPSFFF